MANDALNTNPPTSVIHITDHGSDWFWAVFATMLLSALVVFAWHLTIPRGHRVFHQISLAILITASVAYFCLAADLGNTPVATEFNYLGYPAGTTRQIWYVRYLDWTVTTPLLLLDLVLASGLPLSDVFAVIFFDLVMVITGLVGALIPSSYKWGLFAFGNAAMLYIFWVLWGPARSSAGVLGSGYKSSFTISAGILTVLWTLYPVAWGLADGSGYIHPDSEGVWYGVLDIFAKPVFIFVHLFSISKLDLTALQLQSGKFSVSAAGVSAYDNEKAAPVPRNVYAVDNAPFSQSTVQNGQKKGMFSKKGKYDVTNNASPVVAPRTSETTVA